MILTIDKLLVRVGAKKPVSSQGSHEVVELLEV